MNDDLAEVRRARAALACMVASYDLWEQLHDEHPLDLYRRLAQQPAASHRADARTNQRRWVDTAHMIGTALQSGARLVIPDDAEWPQHLLDLAAGPSGQHIHRAALCLWASGNLPVADTLRRSVAITGSRSASDYGLAVATELAYRIAGAGWTILTTGGYGIDTAVLRGALAADGRVAVLAPGGVLRPHPSGNTDLLARVAEEGLLLSTAAPYATATRDRLHSSQNLLALLSRGTVLVESIDNGPALAALAEAVELDRVAMAVPGPVTSVNSWGCHWMLRTEPRVRLVVNAECILADLDPNPDRD